MSTTITDDSSVDRLANEETTSRRGRIAASLSGG
jgi:hypothetical protein